MQTMDPIRDKIALPVNMDKARIAYLAAYHQGFRDLKLTSIVTGLSVTRLVKAAADKSVRYWINKGIQCGVTHQLRREIGWMRCGTCGYKIDVIPCQGCLCRGKTPTLGAINAGTIK